MQFLSKENQRLLRQMRRKATRRSKQRARYKHHAGSLGSGPLTRPLRPVRIGIMAFLMDLLVRNDY
nr:MAG TPA: hypothetical protein [Caudoviricetes sp.]